MKTTLSPSLVRLANKAAAVPGLKMLLKPFYYRYKARIDRNRNDRFRANGLAVLKLFDKIMVENGIPYTVFAGTLLGAVREHGFIAHDMDIDTAVFHDDRPDDLPALLARYGFQLIHRFTVGNGRKGMEETYLKDDVTLDIFYVYHDESGNAYQCDFQSEHGAVTWEDSMRRFGHVRSRKLVMPMSQSFRRVQFHDMTVSVICNYDEWLSCRYGDTYMFPDPDFRDDGTNRYIVEDWQEADFQTF